MGVFKNKSNPLSERAQRLQEQISELEAQIQHLSDLQTQLPPPSPVDEKQELPEAAPEKAPPRRSKSKASPETGPPPKVVRKEPLPKLRSTALPQGQTIVPPQPEPPPSVPEIEDTAHEETNPFRPHGERTQERTQDLGVRRDSVGERWRRFKRHFRGPPTSNPKLVNYLAAGSIQGLRPLRYEKRVARNRFILLVICLVILLWGIIAVLVKR